ncbi:ParA family protein [Kitasatospora acidiphila]|uniref:ParA family protein n=1 Tax=Kitasatospora acidiphila TaxID=2567942 RepID=A0A540WFX8_9ACTN|nr:ParA family protein [Kitasatospora acidiphila]TQF07931.1 ParA family protein [Kitasatospora acidiphila]
MATPDTDERDKVVTKLPQQLRRELKIRAATVGVDIQDAVTEGIKAWKEATKPLPTIDVSGATSFSTYVPSALLADFRADCSALKLAYNQGVAQSIRLWLDAHPLPERARRATGARRIAIGNQKGGVGKTALTAGIGQALAEMGFRVLMVDFDPQGHLTKQLGHEHLALKGDSLVKHMTGEKNGELADLVLPVNGDAFGGRLFLLPACTDGFLLDAKLATYREIRIKETALEKALEPLAGDFDFMLIDCPPSLGYAMDNALYYVRTREGEEDGSSGLVIPVQAEDSSADAYALLREQIDALCDDLDVDICDLGFIVNLYDVRKGYVLTSSLESWRSIGKPEVIAVVNDLKDQREAVRTKTPLLVWAPDGEQADAMRDIARRIA